MIKSSLLKTEYTPISQKPFPQKTYKNPEQRQFKKYKIDKEINNSISSIEINFCKTTPSLISIFSLDNIYIHDLISGETVSKFPNINEQITSGIFRNDGKVIISGTESGKIIIHDVINKNVLRKYNEHTLEVNCIDIDSSLVKFVSSSKDCSFKLFDMSSKKSFLNYSKAHNDYIRTSKFLTDNLILTGGYDKVIKLWDIREDNKSTSLIFNNNNICEDICVLDSDYFISTSDNGLILFDVRNGQQLNYLTPVQSSINKIISAKDNQRLFIVTGNESFIKVVDLSDLSLRSLYTLYFKNKISAFDVSNDMNHYAIGFEDGNNLIKSKNIKEEIDETKALNYDQEEADLELLDPSKYAEKSIVKNYKYFNRGQYIKNLDNENDVYVEKKKKKKLQKYDKYIKKFQYRKALDSVIETKHVENILGVFEELIDRNALKLALLKRSEDELEIILQFILWKIRDPKAMNILLNVFDLIVNYYILFSNKNEKINQLFNQIEKEINYEYEFEKNLLDIKDEIQTITQVYNTLN